ncbi:MAG: hypothetical protein AAB594_00780 [Patescibacteria group bacterium]
MEHYICRGGCEGVSDKPGTCQAEICPSYEQPLESCSCEDEKHANGSDEKETRKEG